MALGEVRIDLVAEIAEWKKGLGEATDAIERFERETAAQLDQVNKKLEGLSAKEAANAFRELSDLVSGFSRGAQEAAAAADDLADGLKGAFADQADGVAAMVQALGTAKGVLTDGELAQAAQSLQNLGAFSEETLTRVANAAAFTGKSADSLAEAFGRFEKFQDAKSILALQKAIGASGPELEAFGAYLDDNGKLLVDTELRAQAAADALQRFSDGKFGGALDRMSDESARLQGELKLLQQEVGAAGHELRETLAPAGLAAVQALREMPDGVKAFVGLGADFISTGGSMAASSVELAANLKLATGGMGLAASGAKALGLAKTGLATATTALLSPLGLAIVAIGALAVGFAAYTKEIQNSTKAQEDLLKIEEKRLKAYREGKDLLGKSADDLQKLGVTSQRYSLVLQGLQDAADQAGKEGNKALEARLQGEIQEARNVLKELSVREGQARGGLAGTAGQAEAPAGVKPGGAQFTPGRKPPDESGKEREGREKTEREAAERARKEALSAALSADAKKRALEEVLAKHQVTAEERRTIETKIAQIEGKLVADAEKARELSRKRSLDADLAVLNRRSSAGEIDKRKQIAGLEEILRKHKTNADEEVRILQQVAALKGQLRAEEQREQEKAQRLAEKNRSDVERARGEGRSLAQDALTDRIGQLQKRRSEGGPVGTAIEDLIKERLRLQEEEILAEAAAQQKTTESEEARAQIAENAAARIAKARRDATKALEEELDAQDAAKKKQQETAQPAYLNRGGTIQDFGQVQQDLSAQFGIDATRQRIQEQVQRNRAAAAGLSVDKNAVRAAGAIGAAPKADTVQEALSQLSETIKQPTTIVLEVQEGGKTTRTEQSTRPGEPASFNHRLGGTTG